MSIRPHRDTPRPFRLIPAALGLGLALSGASPAWAQNEQAVAMDIDAQPLSGALLQLGQQAGLTIVADPELLQGLSTPDLNATLTPQSALQHLLANTDLVGKVAQGVVTVTRQPATQAVGGTAAPTANETAATYLPPVVVTAAGYEQSILRAPASISIITREELERRPVTDVTDIIREIPGASLTNGEGRNVDISLRGMPPGYTLILIDGRRQNLSGIARKGNNNVRQSFMPPSSAIERIEVIRGPMSTIYGADAMGGVINIITKKVSDRWSGEVSTDYLAQEESRFGDARGSSLFVNAPLIDDLLGLQLTGRYQFRDEDQVARGEPQRTNRNLTGRLWITPNEDHDILLERSEEYFNMYAWVAGRSPGTLWEQTTRRETWSVSHNGRWSFGTSNIAFQKEDADKDGIIADNWTLDAKLVAPWNALGTHVTTVGTQLTSNEVNSWAIETVDGDVIDVIEQQNKAVFAENEWNFAPDLALTIGLRYDDPDDFSSHVSPRTYLVWDATDSLVIKGGIATGFVAPRADYVAPGLVTESEDTTSGVITYTYANPELEPETSINYEISAIWHGLAGAYASLTLFRTDYKDKLSSNTYEVADEVAPYDQVGAMDPDGYCTPAIGNYGCGWSERINIDEAESQGVELASEVPLYGPVSLRTSYTFLQSEQKTGANKGAPLSGSPKHKLITTLDWQIDDRFDAWLSYSYRSRLRASNRPAPGCFDTDDCPSLSMIDLGGTVRANEALRFNLGIYNLANRKWWDYDSQGSVEDGRRYYVRATYQF